MMHKCNVVFVVILLLISQSALSSRKSMVQFRFRQSDISDVVMTLMEGGAVFARTRQVTLSSGDSIITGESTQFDIISDNAHFCRNTNLDKMYNEYMSGKILSKNYQSHRLVELCLDQTG